MRKTRIAVGAIPIALAIGVYFILAREGNEHQNGEDEVRISLVVHEGHPQLATSDVGQPATQRSTATEFGFDLTPTGELVIDADTRGVVEAVSAVADVSELHEITDHLQRTLPAAAGASAADLVERYYHYRIALEEQLRGDEMAELPQDPSIRLEGLQALRVAFFGAELAAQWFGPDEALSREVIARDDRAR
jgi:hypothetical protein